MAQDSTLIDVAGNEIVDEEAQDGDAVKDIDHNTWDVPKPKEGPKSIALDGRVVQLSLCDIGPTIDGLSFAPRKFICNKRLLNSVELLRSFVFLRHVNLAYNELTSLSPLENLHNLLELNASYNKIKEFPNGKWPSMTLLNLSNNEIDTLQEVNMPRLKVLCLNNNKIRRLTNPESGEPYFTTKSFPQLHTLQLAYNKLYLVAATPEDPTVASSLDLQLPHLRALFLAGNALTSLAVYVHCIYAPKVEETTDDTLQLDEQNELREELIKDMGKSALGVLPELSVLHLRNNGLRELDGLTNDTVPKLQYLNLRQNAIDSMEEIEKLRSLPKLQTVLMQDNPLYDMKDYRLEMRVTLQSLRRLDKDIYTDHENEEADFLAEQRRLERATADAF